MKQTLSESCAITRWCSEIKTKQGESVMKTTKLYSLFGVGFTLLAFNTFAMAFEDENAYPGALCQPELSTQPILRDVGGRMFNISTGSQNWICPIVKHVRVAEEIEFARITVVDSNDGGSVSCTLHSGTGAGASFDSEGPRSTGISQTGTVLLNFGLGTGNTISGPDGGYYYFRCTIPGVDNGSSGVATYTVSENDGEN
jgi:hypothetical protein